MSAAAYGWKCQLNENAALPAFAPVLPEADHNEVVGWDAVAGLGRVLTLPSRTRARTPATRCARGSRPTSHVRRGCRRSTSRARGTTPLERLVSLVLLGDLVSIYAAVLRGADPVDIPAIDGLKAALADALAPALQ